ncbi:hypothetical protein KEM55_006700 [Ascosphaera atra]|nr:hypothetical protein KEM55_006700 [Ascosphaera atra]
MTRRSPNPNNLVIPIDSLAVTLNLANDLTGANADVRVPIDGYMRLIGDLYRGTSIAETTTSQEDNHEDDTKSKAGEKEKKQEHVYATSAMLTQWPSDVTFKCYLDSGEKRIGVLDHEHTSVVMLKDWNLKKKARSGLVDVADATIKCKM